MKNQIFAIPSLALSFHQQMALFLKVLQMSSRELESFLQEETEKNPLLEFSFARGQLEQSKETVYKPSQYTELLEQAYLLCKTEKEKRISENILGNLNQWGFLDLSVEELTKQSMASIKEVEKQLFLIQTELEPKGIASKNYQEYLLRKLTESSKLYTIIKDDFSLLLSGNIAKIQKKYHLNETKLSLLFSKLKKIMPSPISTNTHCNHYIEPDIFFFKKKKWTFRLRESYISYLRWNEEYRSLKGLESDEKKVVNGFKRNGKWLFQALSQRKESLEKIAQYLLQKQKCFFRRERKINPLSQKEIAEELSLHPSTVSRIFSQKYADIEGEIIPLHLFLSREIQSHSTRDIQGKIKEICHAHPSYSDEKIREILKEDGIEIARRTIAKYRKNLSIGKRKIRSLFSYL